MPQLNGAAIHTRASLSSPLGNLVVVTAPDGTVHALDFADCTDRLDRLFARYNPGAALRDGDAPAALAAALAAYFAGQFDALDGVAVARLGSPFQQRCWAALRAIPPGQTRSYGEQAALIGQPSAVRAVGLANGANPVAIIQPCHRVVGAGGALTGYAGGVERKVWLLRHEGALL